MRDVGQSHQHPRGGRDTTVASLRDVIADKAGIPSARQKIMAGYPPRALSPSRNGATLSEVGIQNGEMLRVEQLEGRTFSRKARAAPTSEAWHQHGG